MRRRHRKIVRTFPLYYKKKRDDVRRFKASIQISIQSVTIWRKDQRRRVRRKKKVETSFCFYSTDLLGEGDEQIDVKRIRKDK